MTASLHEQALRSDPGQGPTVVHERRQQPRHRLRDAPGTLGWCDQDERVTCGMTVIDISGAGAAVLAGRAPPLDQPAWIRLESGATPSEQLDARVVTISAGESGMYVVRMQFTSWIFLGNVLEQHEEHRLWQRYPARECRARLLWLDQHGEQACPGRLLNISGGGAAVITEAAFPAEGAVWLLLATESAETTTVEARLVAVSIDPSGLRVARLRFVESCPMDLFELAVHGTVA